MALEKARFQNLICNSFAYFNKPRNPTTQAAHTGETSGDGCSEPNSGQLRDIVHLNLPFSSPKGREARKKKWPPLLNEREIEKRV